MSSLPLVSSTYGLVSSVYSSTKHTHPYIRTVCEAAEQGVRSITAVVFTTASPIIDKLEPQSKNDWSPVGVRCQNMPKLKYFNGQKETGSDDVHELSPSCSGDPRKWI